MLYTELLTNRKLNSYLTNIDKLAEEMYRRLIEKMAEDQGVTEKLKGVRPMEWIRKMSNIHACAREIVNSKLVLHNLYIEQEVDHISILHHILLALAAHQTLGFGGSHGAAGL